MGLLDLWVEDRIRAAVARGEFDNLPGAGKPLCFDDDPLIPPEVRMAYQVLRRGGGVPPEVLLLREAAECADGAGRDDDAGQRAEGLRRLDGILQRLESAGLPKASARIRAQYQAQLVARLARQAVG